MKLHERLKRADREQPDAVPGARPRDDSLVDPFAGLKQRAQSALFAKLGARLYDSALGEEKLNALVSVTGERMGFRDGLSPEELRACARRFREWAGGGPR